MHHALTGERDQFHLAFIARLEAHGIARRDIQAKATRCSTIKAQRDVRFKEVIVAAHLNRAITRVGHFENDRRKTRIGLQVGGVGGKNFSWDKHDDFN